jgi:hypothetical protein
MFFAHAFTAMLLFIAAIPAFGKIITVKLGGKLWGVDCRGIVQRQTTGADVIYTWENYNAANPGESGFEVARKAFLVVCGRQYE